MHFITFLATALAAAGGVSAIPSQVCRTTESTGGCDNSTPGETPQLPQGKTFAAGPDSSPVGTESTTRSSQKWRIGDGKDGVDDGLAGEDLLVPHSNEFDNWAVACGPSLSHPNKLNNRAPVVCTKTIIITASATPTP
ncbi:hypothetical protein DL769_008365 [Monosporascus sp. CRB-8-3]|nr:hypothetical protein DL769_008365 [Monosporascus sp. CRB-8-3]